MKLKEYKDEIKPRERVENEGVNALSYQELLAIILRSGNRDKNALELSNDVLLNFDSVYDLKDASLNELREIDGIGPTKAIEIQAAIEFGKRLVYETKIKKGAVLSSAQLGEEFILEMKDLVQEHLIVLFLNSKNEIIKKKTLFIGSLNQSVAHPREIFKYAVKYSSARIIIIHNHPSGDPQPSKQDLGFTDRIMACGDLMGIEVLDHLIIGENSYTSLKERDIL